MSESEYFFHSAPEEPTEYPEGEDPEEIYDGPDGAPDMGEGE